MELLIPISIGSLVLAGLAIFWFRYRGRRARLPGLAAFGLGLLAIVAVPTTHALIGVEGQAAQRMFFVIHVVMCVTLLLLLRTVMSLREPASARYRSLETLIGILLGAAALIFYGMVAWQTPQKQDAVVQMVAKIIPFLLVVAIAARYGWSFEGVLGAGSFLAIGLSFLVYSDERLAPVILSAGLQFAGIVGMLVFFYVASESAKHVSSCCG